MSSITDRLNKEQTGWRPSPDDVVEGTVVEVDERTGEYGSYPVVVLEVGDGAEVAVHGFHCVLKNELAKLRPAVGDRLAVKYLGKPDGKSYELYKVVIERKTSTEPEPDWDSHAKASADALQLEGAYGDEPLPDEPPDYDEF